ncbi:hypothetical protein ACHAXA_008706 [Cyclostephanos tholiformis]|uniref:Phorbol-ester/DAG-type domain-containing protein n=1 Tax=Cyclostephanos tholiformis TaxID=382380 RepID=A0ABD3R2N5_9STRA
MEDRPGHEEDSNARWFYRRCAAARIIMESPLTTLELSLRVFRFVESIVYDDDNDDAFQLRLFDELRDGCMARRRDLNFVYEICDRALDLRDDDDFTERTIRAVAEAEAEAARDGVVPVVGRDPRDGDNDDADAAVVSGVDGKETVLDTSDGGITLDVTAAHPSFSATSRLTGASESLSARDDGGDGDDRRRREEFNDTDDLHCFQLRTRIFGLSLPTFTTELWRIYEHFDLDHDVARGRNGVEEFDTDEEGPEVFDSSNELVDYLDEYCMQDYRATTAEIEATRTALITNSNAYRRRNLRLRHELLEVAYNERWRKSQEKSQSKYGHGHRPCEVCFKGASSVYPRVACRGCGLVVHTNCYGLLDHGGKGGEGNATEVDEKGYFTCDVCAVGSNRTACKQRGQAPQRSGWRVEAWRLHQHPDSVCSLCGWKYIAGGMVRIAENKLDVADSYDAKNRKRKTRRTEEPSESWVHLFCINTLPSTKKVLPGSVRIGGDAALRIREALDKSDEMVREIEYANDYHSMRDVCKGEGRSRAM